MKCKTNSKSLRTETYHSILDRWDKHWRLHYSRLPFEQDFQLERFAATILTSNIHCRSMEGANCLSAHLSLSTDGLRACLRLASGWILDDRKSRESCLAIVSQQYLVIPQITSLTSFDGPSSSIRLTDTNMPTKTSFLLRRLGSITSILFSGVTDIDSAL